MSDEDAYDLVITSINFGINTLITDGCLYDISALPNLDLSQPWWCQSIRSDYEVDGHFYFTSGPISPFYFYTPGFVAYNKTLTDANGIEGLEQTVLDGKWTFDYLKELTVGKTVDLNGDGKQDDEDLYPISVMNNLFGGGMSSRLFQTVREKHGLCYSIGSFTAAYKETGMLAISTAVGRDSEEKALALIREEIEKFREDGITDKELRTARELIKSSIILSLESSSSRMNRLGSGLLLLGKCLTADEIIERYDAVTTESVLALAREKLAPEMMGFSAVGRLAPAEDYLSVFGK